MRVKGYLAARGVEFVAVDVTSEKDALRELRERGIRGIPVVSRGDRYVVGLDLAQVDELVGLASTSCVVPADELAARAVRLLEAATRYAQQLPPSHYDDPFPGLEGVKPPFALPDGHVFVLEDGTPYVPHGTYLGLFRHIIGHGAHFRRFLERPGDDYTSLGLYSQFGEPSLKLSPAELARLCNSIARDIADWWRIHPDKQLDRMLDTFAGPQTLHQMLQRETYSLAQHTRQLMHLLLLLGVEPDGRIGESEFAGLDVPAGIWN